MLPNKPNEIFAYICHFIFAIVIAKSYDVVAKVTIDSDGKFLSGLDSLIPIIEILLVYVIIVSGWIGYTRSMIKWPHTNANMVHFDSC